MPRAVKDTNTLSLLDPNLDLGQKSSKNTKSDHKPAKKLAVSQESNSRREPRSAPEALCLQPGKAYFSVKEVAERFSVKPATIWNWLKNIPNFPKPVCISPGTTRWRAADIIQFEQEHLGG